MASIIVLVCFGVPSRECKLDKSGSEIRAMSVQVYGDTAMKKVAVYTG